jgi:hypothetical protein
MNISFSDFWDGFDPNNNFFRDLILSIDNSYSFIPFSNDTDILIYSCFGKLHSNANTRVKKIFYTGENLRPNYNDCQYSLTFDFDSYNGKNIRLPLWILQIDWFSKTNYTNPQYVIPLEYIKTNPLTRKNKDKFCCIVFNSRSPHRWEIIEKLGKYKKVDCYGKPFGNWFYGEDNKLKTISDYKFNICFENSISPGYYTEKMIHAKTAGCLPLYWADNNCHKDFNPRSFLNLYDFGSLDDFIEKIIYLDQNDSEYKRITSEYLFANKEPTLDNLKIQLRNILCQ